MDIIMFLLGLFIGMTTTFFLTYLVMRRLGLLDIIEDTFRESRYYKK